MSRGGTRVYFGRLPRDTRERDLERFVRGFGRIREVSIKLGYGFVVCFIIRKVQFWQALKGFNINHCYVSLLPLPRNLMIQEMLTTVFMIWMEENFWERGNLESVVVPLAIVAFTSLFHVRTLIRKPFFTVKRSKKWTAHSQFLVSSLFTKVLIELFFPSCNKSFSWTCKKSVEDHGLWLQKQCSFQVITFSRSHQSS